MNYSMRHGSQKVFNELKIEYLKNLTPKSMVMKGLRMEGLL